MLEQILIQLRNKEITIKKAHDLICVLFDDDKKTPKKDSGDFRDPQNYESQSEYLGR